MNWKSKFFWVNIIAVVTATIGYIVTNNMAPEYDQWFLLVSGILTLIGNMLSGMTTSLKLANTKIENAKLRAKLKGE